MKREKAGGFPLAFFCDEYAFKLAFIPFVLFLFARGMKEFQV